MTAKNYQLIIKNCDTEQTMAVGFLDDKKEIYLSKASLSTIDLYTMTFSNSEHLLKTLSYDPQIADMLEENNYKVFIQYKSQGKINTLKPAFDSYSILSEFAIKNNTYIAADKLNFFMNIYMNFIDNGVLFRFLSENNSINEYLLNYIEKYIYERSPRKNSPIYLNKIKIELSRYKNVRDLIIGVFECEEKNNRTFLSSLVMNKPVKHNGFPPETNDSYLNELVEGRDYENVHSFYSLDELETLGLLDYTVSSNEGGQVNLDNRESVIIMDGYGTKVANNHKQKIKY